MSSDDAAQNVSNARSKKMTFQEKLGVKSVGTKLTAASCKQRAAFIRKMVEKNGLSGEKKRKLLNQASWYAWKAGTFKNTKKSKRA